MHQATSKSRTKDSTKFEVIKKTPEVTPSNVRCLNTFVDTLLNTIDGIETSPQTRDEVEEAEFLDIQPIVDEVTSSTAARVSLQVASRSNSQEVASSSDGNTQETPALQGQVQLREQSHPAKDGQPGH